MRLAGVGLLLLSGVALAGQAPYSTDFPPRGPKTAPLAAGTGVIRGRVVAADTDDALRHARIRTTSSEGRAPIVLSDGDGRFCVTGLPAGRFTVTATKAGYAKASIVATLEAGAAVDGVDLQMTRGGSISGLLVDEFGDPSVDVSVSVERLREGGDSQKTEMAAVAQTDDTGAFRLSGLPAGKYVVDAWPRTILQLDEAGRLSMMSLSGRRARDPRVFYPGVNELEAAQPIEIQSGDEKTGVSFEVPSSLMPPPGQVPPSADNPRTAAIVRGRIVRPTGTPASAVRVVAIGIDPPGRPAAVALTDVEGAYSLTIPEAASTLFRLVAMKPSFAPTAFGQRPERARGQPIALRGGETRERVDITLQNLAVVSGTVVDDLGEPVEGVLVQASQLRYAGGQRQLMATFQMRRTDDLGRFRLFGLRPAQYVISASPGQVTVGESGVELPKFGKTYFPGTPDASQSQFVTLRAGDVVTGVDFPLVRARTFRVKGRATMVDGGPVLGGIALMSSYRSRSSVAIELGARIEPNGDFEFVNVSPGEYVLQVVRNRSSVEREGEFAYAFITIADHDVTNLNIRTAIGSTISGRLTFLGGEPPKTNDLEIVAIPVDRDRSPRIGGATTRARVTDDGRFELKGVSGPRRLQVVREPTGWMTKAIVDHGLDISDSTIEFGREEQSLRELEITFTNQVTRIRGQVPNSRDVPASDVSIVAFATRRDLWYERTRFFRRVSSDRDGSFVIEGLPPEEYFVVAAVTPDDPGEWQDPDVLDRLSRGAPRVHLSEGQTLSVTLQKIATR
jgi:Carboxypeptidase regulatory-like domain